MRRPRPVLPPRLDALENRLTPTTLLAGSTEALVTTNTDLTDPTAMEFSPDGRLWVLEQGGRVKLIRADGSAHTALTLTVDPAGERGLLGIAFDPAYDGAGPNPDRVYLYYTTPRAGPADPANNRISQFTVTNPGSDTPALTSEQVLRELPPEAEDGNTNHNGGAIHFGPDGMLYVAVGDHNYDTTPQSAHVSQLTSSPFGKLLRLKPDGTNAEGNPFHTGSATDWPGAVWALGLRNPYTFAFDPGSGTMFVNDVGESAWEEINRGERAANYGWAGSSSPLWEGFESPPPSWANYRNPVMAYDHSNTAPTPPGVAITGGVFYPAGGQFGSAYAGKYFFADVGADFIRVFDPADPGTVSAPDRSAAFASRLTSAQPVDLKVDAAGRLYYLARGAPGEVYRIAFQAPAITRHPLNTTVAAGQPASFSVEATGGAPLGYQWQKFNGSSWVPVSGATASTYTIPSAAGADAGQYRVVVTNSAGSATSNPATLTVTTDTAPVITQQPVSRRVTAGDPVTFSVTATGAAPLSYQWQKLVNGAWTDIAGATAPTFNIAAAAPADAGDYRVVVTNPNGNTGSHSATLTVNQRPTASVSAPDSYRFGQTIAFTGSASDPEGGTLPPAAHAWRVDFGHDTHFHPHLAPFGGATGGSFAAGFAEPDPDQFYRIILTVTDSEGATTTVTRDVRPQIVALNIGSRPGGAALTLDGQPAAGRVPSVVGMPHTLQAPLTAAFNDYPYRFAGWSDGGSATRQIVTPAADADLTARYARLLPGLRADYFDFTGPLTAVPDLSGRAPDVTRTEPVLAYTATANPWPGLGSAFADTFAARHTGYLRVNVPGRYTLTLRSGDGSKLWVDGELWIDNDGVHDMRERSATRPLAPGYHSIRVEMFENTGTAGLSLWWAGPGFARQRVPVMRLFRDVPAEGVAFRQDPGALGLVALEAENADGSVVRSGKLWRPTVPAGGFAGVGVMTAAPNVGSAFGPAGTGRSPRLDFPVSFDTAGTHYVWVRGRGPTVADDSVHVGLDGALSPTADRVNGLKPGYGWTRATGDGPVATIHVPTPGIHTVNLWMFEDGAVVDRLLLTTSPDFVPTGLGPPESPHTAAALNFAGGFAGATGLQFNGSATTAGPAARLTGGVHQAGSVFSAGRVNVGRFATTFDFRLTSAVADGFAFVIQGAASTALGAGGAGLGYQGIANSVAVKFDLFDNAGEGANSTGLYTNGQAPTAGGTSLTPSGIDLHSGRAFRVLMAYAGGTLDVTIWDLETGATARQLYAVDITAVVGSSTAFLGFTGGTGALTATQDILSWGFWN